MNDTGKLIDNPQQWQNIEDCLKSTNHFAGTQYVNVCDGTTHYVANGFWDYTFASIIILVAVLVIVLIGKVIVE